MPTLQRLRSQVPETYMAVLWDSGGQNVMLKWYMTIGYVKGSEYKEKDPLEQLENSGKITAISPQTSSVTLGEGIEISQEKLSLMPEK